MYENRAVHILYLLIRLGLALQVYKINIVQNFFDKTLKAVFLKYQS